MVAASRVSTWLTSWARSAVTETTPTRASTTTSGTTKATSSRVRSDRRDRRMGEDIGARRVTGNGRRSCGGLDHVPGATQGVDHRRAPGVDLATQVGDVELDDVALAAEVVLPDPVEDLRLGQHPLGVAHQVAQQLELGGGEPDVVAAAGHLVALLVQGQVADDQHTVVGHHAAGPAQQTAQPGGHLLQAEGLGDVVVSAGGESGDAVLERVLGGEED